MNHEEPIRDQAEKLRKRIDSASNTNLEKKQEKLPPRSRIHHHKQSKTKMKIKYPILKILGLFFVLLPVVVFSVYTYNEGLPSKGPEQVGSQRVDFETVQITEVPAEDNNSSGDSQPTEVVVPEEVEVLAETAPEDTSTAAVTQAPTPEQPAETVPPAETASSEASIVYHTVQPSETLYRIAMKYYQSQEGIATITEANLIKNNEIHVGQTLLIPMK